MTLLVGQSINIRKIPIIDSTYISLPKPVGPKARPSSPTPASSTGALSDKENSYSTSKTESSRG